MEDRKYGRTLLEIFWAPFWWLGCSILYATGVLFGVRTASDREAYYYRAQITSWVFVFLAGGLAVVGFCNRGWCIGILWSVASFAVGALLGFLFGLPRMVADETRLYKNEPPADATRSSTPGQYRLLPSTNLQEVADWLTKIIVGLTLVEARNLISFFRECADLFASGLTGGKTDGNVAFASGAIVYFLVLGFLSGYLITRLFLSVALQLVDGQAYARAERAVREVGERVEQVIRTHTSVGGTTIGGTAGNSDTPNAPPASPASTPNPPTENKP